MRYKWAWAAVLALSCTAVEAHPVTVTGPHELAGVLAPGDTLAYSLSWGAVAGASSYTVTVTASQTNGTWSGLPNGVATTTPALNFAASAPAWDSVTFTVMVK